MFAAYGGTVTGSDDCFHLQRLGISGQYRALDLLMACASQSAAVEPMRAPFFPFLAAYGGEQKEKKDIFSGAPTHCPPDSVPRTPAGRLAASLHPPQEAKNR